MWGEITYPFPNFNSAAVRVWEWISSFTPHFTGRVITYPCWVSDVTTNVEEPVKSQKTSHSLLMSCGVYMSYGATMSYGVSTLRSHFQLRKAPLRNTSSTRARFQQCFERILQKNYPQMTHMGELLNILGGYFEKENSLSYNCISFSLKVCHVPRNVCHLYVSSFYRWIPLVERPHIT